MSEKFLICKKCKKIVEVLNDSACDIMCCENAMESLIPNTVEAAVEKHIPVIERNGNELSISVGSSIHPMEENHYIAWIYLKTNKCNYRFDLKPGDTPVVKVLLSANEEPLATYAYCNLHGLWKN